MSDQQTGDPMLQQILDDLALRKRSQPSAAAMESYRQLFDHVEKPSPGGLGDWLRTLSAQLGWDSRQQGLTVGARQVAESGQLAQRAEYRLLYVTDAIEVEMMVLPNPSTCHVEGDIVSLSEPNESSESSGSTTDDVTPAWISLRDIETGVYVVESQSDALGRFNLADVQLGSYTMQIILKDGTLVIIADLQLT